MPTNPYGADALQALTRILQYQQKKDRDDVAQSLAIMEYKAKQDVSKYNLASKMLEDSSKYNSMLKTEVVDKFLNESNLRRFADTIPAPEKGDDRDDIEDHIGDLADALNDKDNFQNIKFGGKDYGKITFDKNTSQELASALYNYKIAKDPSLLLDFAIDVHNAKEAGPLEGTAEQSRIINALMGLQYNLDDKNNLKTLSQAVASKRNDEVIMKERMELMSGDYEFQEQLITATEPTEKEKVGESLNQLDALQAAEQIQKHGLIQQQDQEASESFWDATGNVVGTTANVAMWTAPAVVGAKSFHDYQSAKGVTEYLDLMKENTARAIGKDTDILNAKEFADKYGMNKTEAQTKAGRKALQDKAKEWAYKNRTTMGKWGDKFVMNPYKWFQNMDLKWEKVNWKPSVGLRNTLAYSAPLIVPMAAGAVGSIFGDTGQKVGQSVGHGASAVMLQNQIKGRGKRTFLNWLSSGAAKKQLTAGLGAKLTSYAGLAAADGPLLPIGDLVALGLTLNEVHNLYSVWANEQDY
jgi:hypothetical protein